MKYAIIENGKVVNIAKSDEPLADNWIEAGEARIGDVWDGTNFTSPSDPVLTVEEQREVMVVTRGEFAVSSYRAGLITASEAEAWAGGTSLPSVADGVVTELEDRIESLTTPKVRRLAPLVLALQSSLGLTDEQVDALFKTEG